MSAGILSANSSRLIARNTAVDRQTSPGFGAEDSVTTFRQAAHSIKSTSNTFGAVSLGEMARELEMMGRAGDLAGAQEKVDQLAAEYDRVQQALKDLNHG